MSALVDSALLARITEFVADHGIEHDHLVEGAPHLNANLSDGKHVFIKVTRPGEGLRRAANEVTAASWANSHGIETPVPFLTEPHLLRDGDGIERSVSVFSYIPTCHGPALVDRAVDILDKLVLVASTPPPPSAASFDLDYYMARMHRRLANRRDTVATAVLAAGDTSYERAARALSARSTGWSHGDLHLLNVGWWINGRATVFDWESSCLAPVEVDVAQLLRSIEVNARDAAPDYRAAVAQRIADAAHARFDIDWDLVNALIRFRSASAASHLLLHGHDSDTLAADLRLLETPRRWAPSPDAVGFAETACTTAPTQFVTAA